MKNGKHSKARLDSQQSVSWELQLIQTGCSPMKTLKLSESYLLRISPLEASESALEIGNKILIRVNSC